MKLKNIIKIGSFVVAGALPTTSKAQVYMCQACPAGTYSDGTQTKCTPCPAGTYSNGSAASCTKCPAGKYSPAGSSECKSCSAGYYSGAGASSCTICSVGTYSKGNAASCTKCNESQVYWNGASCGSDSGTAVIYCTKPGSTSANANITTTTVTRYLGACQEVKKQCKVERSCTKSVCGGKGITSPCGPGYGSGCGTSTSYMDVGTARKSDQKTVEKGVFGNGDTVEFYTYKVYYTTGGSCDTASASTCTCK